MRPIVLVLVASLALSITIALTLPLLDPDEGRNAEVAREMAASGDLVIPHLAGMPYLDKPPAFFWVAALSIRAFGHTPLAARLPSIVTSLLALWWIGRAAQRAGGTRFTVITMALLAAAPLFAGLSAYVIFDMMLTLCVAVAWLGVAREVETGASVRGRLAMFAAIALGILTKGPVMLAWAIGGSAGAALILRSRAPLRWLAWLPGWIVALLPPAIWFAMVTHRFPEFPHYALVEETFERVTRGSFHRQQPWWFVPAVLVGGALPWSLATPWSAARLRRSESGVAIGAKAGLGFVLFAAVFFTISHSKLVTYLLPAFPPLAWTAATMWKDPASARRSAIVLALFYLPGLLAGLWMSFVLLLPFGHHVPFLDALVHRTALATAAIELTIILGVSRRSIWPLVAAGAALVPVVTLIDLPPAREVMERAVSGVSLAHALAPYPGPISYEHCYSPGTDYLLGRPSRLVTRTGEETTSNYLYRYRASLVSRGLWRAGATSDTTDPSVTRVLAFTDSRPDTSRWRRVYQNPSGARLAAFRFAGSRLPAGVRAGPKR